jgi:hypothetical protein
MNRKIYLTLGVVVCLVATLTVARAQDAGTEKAPVKGSPYLDEAYVEGTILFADNKRVAPIRYNAHKDIIEFQTQGQTRVLDPNTAIKRVSFGESTFVVEKYRDNGITKYGYFTLLDSGKVMLYTKKSVKFQPVLKNKALDGTDVPAEYRRNPDEFYFKIAGSDMTEIKSIKSMIAAFPDKNDELSAYAKKEKISPRNEEELKQLIKYYNSL